MLAAVAALGVVIAVLPVYAQAPVTITWATIATGGPTVSDVYRALECSQAMGCREPRGDVECSYSHYIR